MRKRFLGFLVLATALACSEPAGLAIDATGLITGQAYFDRDADGERDQASDPPIGGIVAAVVLEETGDTIAQATTEADGRFEIEAVPVGTYRLVGRPSALLGDTLEVVQIDSARITVTPADTIRRVLRVSYPTVAAATARTLPAGRRVVVQGIALNAWSSFGDSTVHVQDASGAIRAVRTRPSSLQAGDSVRILGTLGVVNGRTSLVDGQADVVGVAKGLPAAAELTTAAAATAAGGLRPAARVRVSGATVSDTATVGGFRRVGVDDGSGRVELLLSRALPFVAEAFLPGAIVDATGVLAPASGGSGWQLRAHDPAEVDATFATVTAAGARALPAGRRVYVEGIALNAWSAFGDSTLHVADASGAIRAVRVRPTGAVAGDSVRVLGTTGRTDGHPALLDATASVLAFGRGLPALALVGTGAASTAEGGARANGQVRVRALVRDTATVGGDVVLGVDDGSGRLEVVLDRSGAFGPGPYVPGATLDGAGVLVPGADVGTWRLKPRDRDEARVTFATVTTAAARALAHGAPVVVEGIALNAWATFGDSTVHVADATGAIRGVRVAPSPTAAGDRVRLIGEIDRTSGAAAVTRASLMVLEPRATIPSPTPVSTGAAASANGGALDGQLVRVSGTVVGLQTVGTATLYTVNDGTGPVGVLAGAGVVVTAPPAAAATVTGAATAAATAPPTPTSPAAADVLAGAQLTATGVLVPAGGGAWRVRARATGDLVAAYPSVSTAEARALPAGRQVQIEGVALNGWVAFGDGSVHVRDASGTLRVVGLPSTPIFTGDRVRVVGVVSARNGQPVLEGVSGAILASGVEVPAALTLSTFVAANAQGGVRDADLVLVRGFVQDGVTVTQGGDVHIPISDGSGPVTVVLDRDVGFPTGGYTTGMWLEVTGVLVPSSDRQRWEVRPRSIADFRVLSGAPPGAP